MSRSFWGRAPDDPMRAVADADHALGEERELLFRGDLAGVSRVADRRVAEIEELERQLSGAPMQPELIADKLAAFRERAARHAKLLEAAMAGAQAARRKLKAMQEARSVLPGYDASGAPRAQTVNTVIGRKA